MNRQTFRTISALFLFLFLVAASLPMQAQTITATLGGRVLDPSGAVLPGATVTAVNAGTGVSRSVVSSEVGEYRIQQLPPGEYEVSIELSGFRREVNKITLQVGQVATLDFSLQIGELAQEIVVQAGQTLLETTRADITTVIVKEQIDMLPVNGRQFIDFVLLAPGVTIGETTAGSTDVIIEPVTKISFAGQNIHYNLVTVDGADNMSTASGVQKTTPSQEAVQEFRVINTQFSTEAGRAAAGIVNIITKSGTNDWHGSLYEFFRNDKMDANSILASPDPQSCTVPGDVTSGGCTLLNKLRQNQFGGTLGGPISKDKAFLFFNYEGQRRSESPFYNTVILNNINLINQTKANLFGLATENLNQTKTFDYNQILAKVDVSLTPNHYLFVRYFFSDSSLLGVSPLNDGTDLPSAFKDNFFNDNSVVASLTSTLTSSFVNDLRVQYARRFFDFLTASTQPHLEVINTFTTGVNRGNPDFYREPRFEISDSATWTRGKHTVSFGGNFNWVQTEESFPLFYPLEADFACLLASQCANSFEAGSPFVIFFQRNDAASNFTEPTILPNGPAIFQGTRIPQEIRNLAKGQMNHTYNGFFIQDKWQVAPNLTVNFGVRYEWETWPSAAVDTDADNIDPRAGFALNLGTSKNVVLRGGAGLFHGVIPSPLLSCQIPSCGGVINEFPGREAKQDDLNAQVRLFAFASDPFITGLGLSELLLNGTYPDAVDSTALLGFPCPAGPVAPAGSLAGCAFFGDAVIVRFAQDHEAPYGIQMTLSLGLEPVKDTALNVSYLRVKGVDLGSFFNVNQPFPTGQQALHDSAGNLGLKDTYFCPASICGIPDAIPFTIDPGIAVYFEADSLWESVYDGLLVDFRKLPTGHVGFGLSYTWSKSIDNGPNPSFVLIPQDSRNFERERTISSDHIAHRFVGNATILGPKNINPFVNDFRFGTIVTLQSARFFTRFAGFDANGDIFGNNDRVGIEPRNTFKGDQLYTVDLRVSRTLPLGETADLEFIAEAFNIFNTLNVRFFNTAYGAADFCQFNATAAGCLDLGGNPLPLFRDGSPNPGFGTPRAIFNPRQIQFALRLTF